MKKDIFDVEISVYNGVKDVYGTTCKLRDFLFSKKHVSEIERLRSLPTKEEKNEVKKRLPMAIFACFGVLALIVALMLKAEDKKKGYGLQEANIKK